MSRFHFHPGSHDEASHDTAGTRSEARLAITAAHYLEQDVERVHMIAEALWMLLKEKLDLEDADLLRLIAAIDLRDGKLDGRVARATAAPCPGCRRNVARSRTRCLFCGEALTRAPFER